VGRLLVLRDARGGVDALAVSRPRLGDPIARAVGALDVEVELDRDLLRLGLPTRVRRWQHLLGLGDLFLHLFVHFLLDGLLEAITAESCADEPAGEHGADGDTSGHARGGRRGKGKVPRGAGLGKSTASHPVRALRHDDA
jgi:hypothetical protein